MQQTLKKSISFTGVCLHSGINTNVKVHPAPADTGIKFKRIDLKTSSKENIIDELISNYSSKLDWGVSWIKFVAAVAPLLGLLGTVIGMIETFQAITLFGTGDPKQMAGGISQALITTMLGLMVAAPLLGFYTYISDRVNTLVQIVEEKGSYLLSKE